MTLLEKYSGILGRIRRPDPIASRVREVFESGKREQLLAGRDADGDPFAPLAPSTLRHHEGSDTPLVPHGPASRVVAGYRVAVRIAAALVEIVADWPGLDWIRFHKSGTRRMPRRDPGGFRAEDRAEALRLLSEHVHGSG